MRGSVTLYGQHFKLLVVGGGAGGLGASHKFARKLPKGAVGVIEPHEKHYYQPGFTLIGGGLATLAQNTRVEKDLIHPNSTWLRSSVKKFSPEENKVVLEDGEQISYDFMVIATGISPRFDKIRGLAEAIKGPGVSSNYSPLYCEKTFQELDKFESGVALFTFPNTPVKCPGALQKAAYLADDIFRKNGKRDGAKIVYATTLARLFGVDKYRIELEKVAKEKDIEVRTRSNLVEVDGAKKTAKFELLDEQCQPTGKTWETEYSFLHVGPPCHPIEPLLHCQPLTDVAGYVDVDPKSLRSKAFSNVFAVGDCANSSNAKTAAAVSSHLKTVEKNLTAVMEGRKPEAEFDGYGSCPLLVGMNKVILAEFNSAGPMETLPIDQSKPSRMAFLMKRYFMPFLYWHGLIKGRWNGPATIRKIAHLGMK